MTPSIAPSATGTRASGKTMGAQSTTGKLNSMADNFNNFYGDLEEETTVRKQAEEARVARIERECGKIERVIATETAPVVRSEDHIGVIRNAELVQRI